MDSPGSNKILTVSQGSHLVLPREFLPSDSALMVPRTSDGRVLFAIPWHDRVVVGTTDDPVPEPAYEPTAMPGERAFLLEHVERYLGSAACAQRNSQHVERPAASGAAGRSFEHRRDFPRSHHTYFAVKIDDHHRRQVDDLSKDGARRDRPHRRLTVPYGRFAAARLDGRDQSRGPLAASLRIGCAFSARASATASTSFPALFAWRSRLGGAPRDGALR